MQFEKSGATVDDFAGMPRSEREITKADMFALGLSGGEGSAEKRAAIAKELGLPSKLSANMLLDVINRLLTYEELCSLTDKIQP